MKCQTLPAQVENGWKSINNGLLEAADEICDRLEGAVNGTEKLCGGTKLWIIQLN